MPQKRGIPRPQDVERIRHALEMKKLAEWELTQAVIEAMRHGGSIREISRETGISDSTILPTPDSATPSRPCGSGAKPTDPPVGIYRRHPS